MYPTITISARVYRFSGYVIVNVMAPTFFFVLMAGVGCFAVPTGDQEVRLAVTLTLVLAATANKFITGQLMPTISYLTIIDKYVLACQLVMVLLVIEAACVGMFTYVYHRDAVDTFDPESFFFFDWAGIQTNLVSGRRQLEAGSHGGGGFGVDATGPRGGHALGSWHAARQLNHETPVTRPPGALIGPALIDLVCFIFYCTAMLFIHGWFLYSGWRIFRWRAEIDPDGDRKIVDSWVDKEEDVATRSWNRKYFGFHTVAHRARHNRFSVQYSAEYFARLSGVKRGSSRAGTARRWRGTSLSSGAPTPRISPEARISPVVSPEARISPVVSPSLPEARVSPGADHGARARTGLD